MTVHVRLCDDMHCDYAKVEGHCGYVCDAAQPAWLLLLMLLPLPAAAVDLTGYVELRHCCNCSFTNTQHPRQSHLADHAVKHQTQFLLLLTFLKPVGMATASARTTTHARRDALR